MKRNFRNSIFTVALVLAVAFAGYSQVPAPADVKSPEALQANPKAEMRPNILAQLGLERSQMQQIRRLNAERKPLMEAAQRRFRDANRALDEAIYADRLDEVLIQDRLKEVQAAQADVAKIRYSGEVAIRSVLNSEQLVRFRELRQQFEVMRQGNEIRQRQNRQSRDADTPINGAKQIPLRRFLRQNQQKAKP